MLHAEVSDLQDPKVVKRRSLTSRPVSTERIERALDRVAEIIVVRGDQGEAWLSLYEFLECALRDHKAKAERMAAVRERVTRSKGQTAEQSS